MAIEIKRLVVKVDANGKVTYLTSSPIRQYEDKINVLYVWFDGIDLGETATVKLHAKNSEEQVLTEEQFLTPYVTTADETFVVTKNGVETSYTIPDNTKLYEYAYPQGLTTVPRNLVHSVVAYLADGSIFASEKFTRFIEETPEPIGDFEPDVIDTTLEEILASKTDVVDFEALRNGTLDFNYAQFEDLSNAGVFYRIYHDNGWWYAETPNGNTLTLGGESQYETTKNTSGVTINDGMPVMYTGSQGDFMQIAPASSTGSPFNVKDFPQSFLGVATETIAHNAFGKVSMFGQVKGIVLWGKGAESWVNGTVLYFDPSDGYYTSTRPAAPNPQIIVGIVYKRSSTSVSSNGILFVRPSIGYRLRDLHDVFVNGEPDGYVLEKRNNRWSATSRLSDVETQADDLQDQIDNIVIGEGILLNEAVDPTTAVEITRTGNFAWTSVNGNMTFNALNGAITLNSESFVSNATDSYAINTETLNINSDVANINATTQLNLVSPDIQLSGNVTISGDLFVQGTGYETELETLLIKDNELVLRDGALAGLGSGEYAGFRFKLYDGTNDGLLVVGNDGFARVGDVGALQILATRQDSPTANGVAYFNNTDKRFDTNSTVLINPAAIGNVPLTVNALSGQTANLFELKVASGIVSYINAGGNFRGAGVANLTSANNSYAELSNNGTVISRNIADSNPALKVNLANASSTGNIVEFQTGGSSVAWVSKAGALNTPIIYSSNSSSYGYLNLPTTGVEIGRNRNDALPTLIINNLQGTGDILRLQFGGATKSVFNKDGWLGVGTSAPAYKVEISGTNQQTLGITQLGVNATVIGSNQNDQTTYISNTTLGTYGFAAPEISIALKSNGNVGIGTTSPSAKLHVAGSLKVDTGGTLLASGTGIATVSTADLRTYKYIELRAGVVGRSSTKIPSSLFYYSVGGSEGINLTVSYYYSDLPTEHVEIPIRVNPANSSYTSIDVLTDTTSYDVSWEILGWNY